MELWLIWVILIAVLVIIELFTQWISTFCLAIGCLGGLVANLIGVSFAWQLMWTGIMTVVGFIVFMPYFKKRIHQKSAESPKMATGMEALIGRKALVVQEITPETKGRVKIDGDNWQAESDMLLHTGSHVVVTGYDSIVLKVRLAKEGNFNFHS